MGFQICLLLYPASGFSCNINTGSSLDLGAIGAVTPISFEKTYFQGISLYIRVRMKVTGSWQKRKMHPSIQFSNEVPVINNEKWSLPERCFLSSTTGSRSPVLPGPPLEVTEDPNWCGVVSAGCVVGLWWPPRPKCDVGPPAAAPVDKILRLMYKKLNYLDQKAKLYVHSVI